MQNKFYFRKVQKHHCILCGLGAKKRKKKQFSNDWYMKRVFFHYSDCRNICCCFVAAWSKQKSVNKEHGTFLLLCVFDRLNGAEPIASKTWWSIAMGKRIMFFFVLRFCFVLSDSHARTRKKASNFTILKHPLITVHSQKSRIDWMLWLHS